MQQQFHRDHNNIGFSTKNESRRSGALSRGLLMPSETTAIHTKSGYENGGTFNDDVPGTNHQPALQSARINSFQEIDSPQLKLKRPGFEAACSGDNRQSASLITDKDVKVFFKSLKKSTTKTSVAQVLSTFGELKYIRLPYSKLKKKNLGYGYVIFQDSEVTEHVLNNIQTVSIDNKLIELRRFEDNNNPSNQELKKIEKYVEEYVKQSEAAKPSKNSFGKNFPKLRENTEAEGVQAQPKTAYYTRWNLHSIKPTHTYFHNVRKERSPPKDNSNLLFRIVHSNRVGIY